jgi:hypothetical protein
LESSHFRKHHAIIDFSLMPKFLSDKKYIRIQHADGTHSVKLLNSLKLRRNYEKQKQKHENHGGERRYKHEAK